MGSSQYVYEPGGSCIRDAQGTSLMLSFDNNEDAPGTSSEFRVDWSGDICVIETRLGLGDGGLGGLLVAISATASHVEQAGSTGVVGDVQVDSRFCGGGGGSGGGRG